MPATDQEGAAPVTAPETAQAEGPTNAAEQFAARARSPVQRIQHLLHSNPWLSPLLVLVIGAVIFTIINPRFGQPNTISLMIQQVAVIAALAIGQTIVILTAGIDLSVGAITILAMMFSADLAVNHGVPGVLAVLIGVAVGALCGFINGALVTRIKLPPFIVTLGTLSIFTAIALLYTKGVAFRKSELPDFMNWTGTIISIGDFKITTGVLIVVALAVVVAFALNQTAWGRHIYAVGGDLEASRLVGIRTNRVLLSAYVVAGVIYGITAWVLIGRAGGASTNSIAEANLESITAAVIGGTSLFGGRGGIAGTVLGALIVVSFRMGLSLAGVDDQWQVLAVGVLILVAVAIDQWIRKVRA